MVVTELNDLNENEEFIQKTSIASNSYSKEKTFLLIIIFFLSFLMVSHFSKQYADSLNQTTVISFIK